jgi:gluconolactonase
MRLAQFEIPAEEPGSEPAELVIYYFGGATGGVKANIERWIGQFHEAGRKVQLRQGKSKLGEYFLADITGTWKKPIGPPFAQRTVDQPNSRVIGVVLIAQTDSGKDYYFLKLSGPDAVVKGQAQALREALAAQPDSEKPFPLDDVDG